MGVQFLKNINFSCKTKSFVSYGLPLLLSGVLASLNSRVDRLIISDLISLDAVGKYAALSNMLIGITALVFMVIALPLYPELAKNLKDKDKLYLLHQKYLDMLLIVTIPASVGLCLLAEPIMEFVLGDKFQLENYTIFYYLCLSAFVVNFKGNFIDHGLQFKLKTKVLPLISSITIIANVFLAYTLIGYIGLEGAALAALLSSILALFLSLFYSIRYKYKFPKPKYILNTMSSTVIMASILILCMECFSALPIIITIICLVIIGLTSYFSVHLITNTMSVRTNILKRSNK